MQQLSPFEIKQRLLTALDTEYNVVDMATVLEIVTILERTPITKEALETTRLGRDINELRRKTRNESLAKRAKDLVRRWRDLIIPPQTGGGGHPTVGGTSASSGAVISTPDCAPSAETSQHLQQQPQQQNGKSSSRSTLPKSAPISPAISLPASDRSSVVSPALSASVDRTHASNKRLRKDVLTINIGDGPTLSNPCSPAATSSADEYLHETAAKRMKLDPSLPRVNGDHYSDSVGSDCEIVSVTPVTVATPPPKQKNRRKKAPKDRTGGGAGGSAGGEDDIVKEKIASIARLHKVKTTQELLAGLQSRSTDANSPASFSSSVDHDVAKNKSEHIHRFLRSQEKGDGSVKSEEDELEDGVESGSGDEEKRSRRKSSKKTDLSTRLREPSPPAAPPFPTAEEILARLPPLDLASIRWDDDEVDATLDEPRPPPVVTEADVDRLLSEPVEGLNGNTERWADGSTEFRTWDQVFTTPMAMPPPPPPPPPNSSIEPAPPPPPSHGYLFILPYVVID